MLAQVLHKLDALLFILLLQLFTFFSLSLTNIFVQIFLAFIRLILKKFYLYFFNYNKNQYLLDFIWGNFYSLKSLY